MSEYTDQYSLNNAGSDLLELSALHNSLLVNGNGISTGTGDNPTKQDPSYVVKRPWIDPPDGYVPYDQETVVVLPAVGTAITIVTITVPAGYDGVINAFSWNFLGGGFTNGSGDLVVQITRNGAPVRNFDNILVEKGTPQIPRVISPIRVYSNQVISINILHAANPILAGDVVGSLVGYFYPSES